MATTTHDTTETTERPAGAPPAPGAGGRPVGAPPAPEATERGGRRKIRLRDMYVERRTGPVTLAERRRAALSTLIGVPIFAGVVMGIQAIRGREVPVGWVVSVAVVTAVLAGVGFAFPRVSLGGNAHLRNIDWSKESMGSKIAAIVAVLLLVAVVVARAIWRMDR